MNEIQKHISNIQQSAQADPRFKQYDEVTITPESKEFTNRVFKSLLPHFPAWRQSCPEPDDLGRLKNAWTKAIMRHELKTGKKLNVKAGLLACEESETDWLCSVGRFIKMCDQSDELLPMAQRALDLFNSAQRQTDTIGKMVVSKHAFDLKQMRAADTNKQFISLYLSYAENNEIKPLDAFAITETVQLSEEQLKDKQRRIQVAQNEHLGKMNSLFGKPVAKIVEKEVKSQGVKKGSLKVYNKSPRQLEIEKQRQLESIKGKLK